MNEYENIVFIGLIVSIILIFIIITIIQGKIRKDESGWDMFCGDHFEEAKEHIQKRHPKCDVGWGDALRDEEFDDDESMECGYPDCTKESKYEIYWMNTGGWDLRSSEYVPLERDEETIGDE